MQCTNGSKRDEAMPRYVECSNADIGFDTNDTFQAPFRFPFYSIIHGIAYDGNGVIIYAYFPRLIALKNGRPSKWGFGCAVVSTDFTEIFHVQPADRLRFITAMLIIQHHATYLSKELQRLRLSNAYAHCDRLWKVGRLGCHWINFGLEFMEVACIEWCISPSHIHSKSAWFIIVIELCLPRTCLFIIIVWIDMLKLLLVYFVVFRARFND